MAVSISFKPSINSAFRSSQSARKPSNNTNNTVKLQQRKAITTKNSINNQSNNENKMRQQTLHDLNVFKQRKKRQTSETTVVGDAEAAKLKANAENNPHYLRSHSTTASK